MLWKEIFIYLAGIFAHPSSSTDLAILEGPPHGVLVTPGHALLVGGHLHLQLPQLELAHICLEACLAPTLKEDEHYISSLEL